MALEKTEALENGSRNPYNPLQPWAETFAQLTRGESDWWNSEIHQPCTWIRGNVAKVDKFLHGDALAASSSTVTTTTAVFDASRGTQAYDSPPTPTRGREKKRERGNGYDAIKRGHQCTHNRKDAPLCEDSQDGSCCEFGANSRCKRNPKKAHQCSICL